VIARAVLMAFDDSTYTATVRYVGSLSAVVAGVPVSRAIDDALITQGRTLAVALFTTSNPHDAMVIGVW